MYTARTTRIGAVAYLCLALATSAPAQDIETRVIVPDSPGGANFAGCFRADRDLYGPHRLTMCFERRGTYTIRGGARCDGTLTWRSSGRDIFVDLRRASCRGRVAWERADVTCRGTGGLVGAAVRDALARVLTSNLPRLRALACTYRPRVRGYPTETFRANRR
jgi:hypothetical protein